MNGEKTIQKNQRRYSRIKFHMRTEIRGAEEKDRVKCATFDLSEGGIRVISDHRLKSKKYEIHLGKHKFMARVVHLEKKESSLMSSEVFYYGMQFMKPISAETKSQLVALAQAQFAN